MSHECCSFCETLPGTARKGWGGKPAKCPLCKSELWEAQNGATYRLGGEVPALSTRWLWAAGTSLVVGLYMIVGLGVFAFRSTEVPTPVKVEVISLPPKKIVQDIPTVTGPTVIAKTEAPLVGARAKPLPPPIIVNRAPIANPHVVSAVQERPTPIAKRAAELPPSAWSSMIYGYSEDLEGQLRTVPQVDLDADYLTKSKDQIAKRAKEIVAANKNGKDAFVRKLIKERDDLAGMPFLLGKDCALTGKEPLTLAVTSLQIRSAIAQAHKPPTRAERETTTQAALDSFESDRVAARFAAQLEKGQKVILTDPSRIPAFRQILTAQDQNSRQWYVRYLREIKDAKATEALVNQAIFDLDADVRLAALAHLRERPKDEYRPALKKALRYPWQPVVRQAAFAVVTLDVKEMIPDLVGMLDEPDPSAPFAVKGEDGKKKMVVRELVRINHHRNCMLCHAPIAELNGTDFIESRTLPVGPAPSGQEPLPPSSSVIYYSARPGITLVRADITYLRQDFSIQQPVENSGKWSTMQRFDFLVRARALKPGEAPPQPAGASAAYKPTIADALVSLTGRNAAPTAQAWRAVLAQAEPGVEAKVKPRR
jgi:hypothetical protein